MECADQCITRKIGRVRVRLVNAIGNFGQAHRRRAHGGDGGVDHGLCQHGMATAGMSTQYACHASAIPVMKPLINRLLAGAQNMGNIAYRYAIAQSQQAQCTWAKVSKRVMGGHFVQRHHFIRSQCQFAFHVSAPSVLHHLRRLSEIQIGSPFVLSSPLPRGTK